MANPGELIKTKRIEKNIGLKTAAASIGISDSSLQRIEVGITQYPAAQHLKRIAAYYSISIVKLYKEYGYLSDEDLEEYIRCFKNTDKLSDEQTRLIQEVIDNIVPEKNDKETLL